MKSFVFFLRLFLSGTFLAMFVWSTVFANEPASDSALEYLTQKNIVQGYADGSFGEERSINRAEFVTLLVKATGESLEGSACFTDVGEEWYALSICSAKNAGWVSGYADGIFKPADPVTVVEATALLAKAFELPLVTPQGSEWYSAALETLSAQQAIPSSLNYYSEELTRGEAMEMLWRVMANVEDQPATQVADFFGATCSDFEPETIAGVDMDRVRATWLTWYNTARAAHGLSPYEYSEQLDRTADIWSSYNRDRGTVNHKRPGQTAYYDYDRILNWFKDLGLTFSNHNRITFTENIGYGPYACGEADCTDELLSAIRSTFDFYMAEAGKSDRPHYNSIMNSEFKNIGLGIVVKGKTYYLTVHYGTELTAVAALCD